MNLRPELAQHLRQRLDAFREGFRQNLVLLGPPGSGKTYQLLQLLAPPTPSLLLICCPLYRESCRSFLCRLHGAILHAGLSPTGETPSLDTLMARAEQELPQTAAAIRQTEHLLSRRLYGEAFNRTLDVIPILTAERRQPCVLILDEFLFLEELGLTHAFHELGKRVMTWPSTLFILTSSSVHRARAILREKLQLLFGQFELISLEALDPKPAGAWVLQELKGMRGIKAMSPFLIQWLGTSPWYLGLVLKRLKERARLSPTLRGGTPGGYHRSAELTEALFLQTAWDLLSSPEGTLHQWCASRMEALAHGRLGARATEALIHVAEGARTTTEIGKRIGRGGLAEALQLLVEHDLAERNGTCWMVADPILRCWLSTVFSAQRSGSPVDGAEVRRRVERTLRSLWMQWVEAHELSFSEQIVALFGKFTDDTVSLDSKTGRLPKFQTIATRQPSVPGSETYLIADGPGKRWCASVHSGAVDEQAIAHFDAFCRAQTPRPSRKVLIMQSGMDDHARLLAKAANMWVWEPHHLSVLRGLYGS